MPNGKDSPLSPEQIRQQVDQIMDRWQSYPSFASLLSDLMKANGLSDNQLSLLIYQGTNHVISKPAIRKYRSGETDPAYTFIEDFLTTNALHLDPKRLHRADSDRLAGDQRIAIFTAAGLIEVTPESIREWNREVLAGHRQLIESKAAGFRPRWGDLMTKLLTFHQQAGRQSQEDIAMQCNTQDAPIILNSQRIGQILRNNRTPSENERLALYHYAQLENDQIATIEDAITTGVLPLGFARRRTIFADALIPILDKLSAQDISQTELAHRSKRLRVPGGDAFSQTSLSAWYHGREQPTLPKLRTLTAVLRQFGPGCLTNPVTPQEIDRLVVTCGFRTEQLGETTHDVIARIDEHSRINQLLRDLQAATDTCLPTEEVHRRGADLGYVFPGVDMLRKWEDASPVCPTPGQVQDLLFLHNEVIRQKGFPPLHEEEIAKVVAVAARDHARWQSLSHAEKLAEQRPHPRRRPPTPSFDGTEQGR
ncbi:MAG TPA: hypothetical protein VMG10_32005 [Gemmataceae bacterium]|nr:hypothetical protein [Gemmataceae bacterium]